MVKLSSKICKISLSKCLFSRLRFMTELNKQDKLEKDTLESCRDVYRFCWSESEKKTEMEEALESVKIFTGD